MKNIISYLKFFTVLEICAGFALACLITGLIINDIHDYNKTVNEDQGVIYTSKTGLKYCKVENI